LADTDSALTGNAAQRAADKRAAATGIIRGVNATAQEILVVFLANSSQFFMMDTYHKSSCRKLN
jgi:uncharacterized phage protein gp47/JayE